MKDLKRLFKYLRPHLPIFLIALAAMFLSALLETATGALLVPIIDQFQNETAKNTPTLFSLQNLIPDAREDWFQAWKVIAALLVSFTILNGIASYLSTYLMAKIGQSAILELREELYEHLLNQSASFFENHRTNFLVSRLVTSCAAVEATVSANLRDVFKESLMLIAFISAAFYFNWRLMLGALIIGPIIGTLTSKFSKSLRKLSDVSLKGNQRLTDTAQESLANQTIVKAYTAEAREQTRFTEVAEFIANANLRSAKIAATSPPLIETIGMIAIVTFFYFGLREINVGNMEAGQFFAFLFFLLRSYDPMRKLSRQHNEINKGFAAAADVWEVLDETNELPEKENAVEIETLEDKISLRNVWFRYQNEEKQILKDISLDIEKGQMVALVGESGGGKSSLIKLIQRLYDPTKGSILWDNNDLQDVNFFKLKKQIALVTQETVLFNDTIRYNISYGNPNATDAEIKHAAKVAFADRFIEELPEKYDTLVGERGTFLSGGQRQRIAIARAVLVHAPVLILDEATSALDAESERFVKKAIENLMKDRTSIVIAHRLSTVRRADKIVVLQRGEIVEQGTHDELIEKSGTYKKLYELQFAESEILKAEN